MAKMAIMRVVAVAAYHVVDGVVDDVLDFAAVRFCFLCDFMDGGVGADALEGFRFIIGIVWCDRQSDHVVHVPEIAKYLLNPIMGTFDGRSRLGRK